MYTTWQEGEAFFDLGFCFFLSIFVGNYENATSQSSGSEWKEHKLAEWLSKAEKQGLLYMHKTCAHLLIIMPVFM
jgi:hypothetical protein